MDGALGAGTAVMFEPFSDDPGNSGLHADRGHPALEDRGAHRRRRRRGPPGRGARDRRQARSWSCSTSTRASRRRTGRGTGGSASSTRSICARTRSPASPSRASSPRCSRTTPSTTGDGRTGVSARSARLGAYAFRWLLDARATVRVRIGLGRRAAFADSRNRRGGHARHDRRKAAGRLGARAEDPPRRSAEGVHRERAPTPPSRKRTRARSRSGSSPTSSCFRPTRSPSPRRRSRRSRSSRPSSAGESSTLDARLAPPSLRYVFGRTSWRPVGSGGEVGHDEQPQRRRGRSRGGAGASSMGSSNRGSGGSSRAGASSRRLDRLSGGAAAPRRRVR